MKSVSAVLALFAVSLAAPQAHAQDDARTRRILERIEKELTESRRKLRAEIRDIIRAEIEKASPRKPKAAPAPKPKPKPKPKPNVLGQIRAFAGQLKDDGGLNTRLRNFIRTDKGAAYVQKQLIESAEYETFEAARDAYCVKGKDGKYVVREEHVAAVREMLDEVAPAAAPQKVRLGIVAEDFAPGERKKLGIAGGIKIVEVRGAAKAAGLRGGDILLEIGGKPVTEETILRILEQYSPGNVVKVKVLRNRQPRTFELKFAGSGE